MPFRFRDFFGDFVPDPYPYIINIVFFQFDEFFGHFHHFNDFGLKESKVEVISHWYS